ncbi:MAG: patatin-like phospholipase family protein [Bacteroidales bacterium]
MKKKKVALVLSGGGARGIAHIGVIEELEKQGYEITSIAGTSMGALVGGFYALGKLEEYKEWLFTLDRFKVFTLFDFTLSRQGFVKGDKVLKKIKEFISDRRIEDLGIAYAAVAVDIIENKEVVFTSGSIFEAIRASISIPTVFTPVKSDHGLLVDGGVLDNLPVKYVKRNEGDMLVAVNVNANIPVDKPELSRKEEKEKESIYQKRIKEFYAQLKKIGNLTHEEKSEEEKRNKHEERLDFFNLLNRTISLMTNRIADLTLQQHNPDLLIEVSHESCGIFDFFKAEEMVETGRYIAHKSLLKHDN